jgi:hypothetical protein
LENNLRQRRLRRGLFSAAIIPDRFRAGSLFHYVVQRQDSAEILAWGQERSENAAVEAAEHQIVRLLEIRTA